MLPKARETATVAGRPSSIAHLAFGCVLTPGHAPIAACRVMAYNIAGGKPFMGALPDRYVSLEDYLELEEVSGIKHVYYQGAAFALAGASVNNDLIVGAVFGNLFIQLDGKSCRPHTSDLRLKVEAVGLLTYPDVSVICGEAQLADSPLNTYVNPTVLVEVLSRSTAGYDRGRKADFYRTIPSLREYLLIAQDRPCIEHWRRQGDEWLPAEFSSLEDKVALASIDCILPLAAIYERVRFDVA